MTDDNSIDVVRCPSCGSFEEDFDGLGFIRCEVCGYCAHIEVDKNGFCLYCGEVVK